MKAVIDNYNNTIFKLNGISYHRIFIAVRLDENTLKIVNAYDSRLEILPPTNFKDVELGDKVYSDISSFMDNLQPILFQYPDIANKVKNVGYVTPIEGLRFVTPKDATYFKTGIQGGAIKITLPMDFSNTNIKMWVSVFDEQKDKSFEAIISGYSFKGWDDDPKDYQWVFTSVQIIGSNTLPNYFTRFGKTGNRPCVYIGELNASIAYPAIAVRRAMLSFSNVEKKELWETGWKIEFEKDSFDNVQATHKDNFTVRK